VFVGLGATRYLLYILKCNVLVGERGDEMRGDKRERREEI